jgi:acetylornithine deacetylase
VEAWTADAAVVTEPTDLQIAVGHKGFAWIEVETRGRAAHGSRPREGRDAILRMGRVLARLEQLDRDLQSRPPHPVMGTGSLHASIIGGGRELSSYPDRCTLQLERRTVADEPDALPLDEVVAILSDLRAEDATFEAGAKATFGRPPYEIPRDHALTRALGDVLRRSGRQPVLTGMTFWTDAAVLGHAGIPSLLFGPSGAGLHGVEEYVEIASVLACRDALAELARTFC